jgi:hypothetical protein
VVRQQPSEASPPFPPADSDGLVDTDTPAQTDTDRQRERESRREGGRERGRERQRQRPRGQAAGAARRYFDSALLVWTADSNDGQRCVACEIGAVTAVVTVLQRPVEIVVAVAVALTVVAE